MVQTLIRASIIGVLNICGNMIYIYMVLQTLMPPQWTLVSHCFLAEVLACGLFTNSIYVFLTGISGTFPNSFIHLLTMWTGICRYFSLQSPGDQGAQTCIKQEPANEVGKLKLKEKKKKINQLPDIEITVIEENNYTTSRNNQAVFVSKIFNQLQAICKHMANERLL